MATQLQLRRGTTTETDAYTGAVGEVIVNTTKDTLVVQDGATQGGHELAKANAPSFTGGIDVTGTVVADGLTVEGNGALFTLDNGSNAATFSNTNGNVVLNYDAAEAGRSFTLQQNGRNSLRVNNSGDVSFYEDTGSTPKMVWDASAESLGIGTDSPVSVLTTNVAADGVIQTFQVGGTTNGSIGTNGTRPYFASTDCGIRLGGADLLPATSTGVISDAAVSLGSGAGRWANLYLSSGVYLGGTDGANKLDDYEKGVVTGITCVGSTSGSATVTIENATYTKIGNVVNLYLYLTMDFSVDDIVGEIEIANLPFANANNNLQNVSIIHQNVSTTYLVLGGRVTSNDLRIQTNSSSDGLARADCVSSSNRVMMIGLTYNTNA